MDPTIQSERPRRSSFTHHLHRVLHLDKAGNRRQSDVFRARADLETRPAFHQQTHSRRMSDEQDYHGVIRNEERRGHQPHNSSSPVNAVSYENEPRFYSTQALPPGSLEHVGNSPSTNEVVGPSKGSNVTQKKDRRATMRLEADRIELEKRLLKLEQAGKTQDSIALRRESRRLTKKQPFGSSSRASSASADETRRSSRFSSVFSRRTSRSRSSSTNGGDKCSSRRQSTGTEVIVKVESPHEPRNSTASPVPNTLPVRLGAAISKRLAVASSSLISPPIQSAQSQAHFYSDATSPDTTISAIEKPTLGEGMTYLAGHGSNSHGGTDSKNLSMKDPHVSSDLDRASFAATLKLGRGSETSQTEGPHKQDTRTRRKPLKTYGANHGTSNSSSQLLTPSLHPSILRNVPIRSLAENVPQRHSKKFPSSPLAGAPTVNELGDATSIDNTILRAPIAVPNKRASGIKVPHTLLSSRALDRPEGLETVTRGPPLEITDKNITSSQSTNLLGSSSAPRKFCSKSGEVTTSYHAKICSVSTVNRDLKAESPHQPLSLLDKWPRESSERAGQGEGTASEPPTEKARPKTIWGRAKVEPHLDVGKVSTKQNAPTRSRRMSNVSLSTNLSQDQGSDEYNTADEAISVLSQSRDEVVPASPPVDSSSASTSRRSAQDPLEKDPKKVLSNTVLPQQKGAADKAKQVCHEQPVTKLFVICCNCKSWHDMPSEVYGRLSHPGVSHLTTQRNRRSLSSSGLLFKKSANARSRSVRKTQNSESPGQDNLESSSIVFLPSLGVKCCWCEHPISRTCCKAWTTVVQLRERQF